MGLRGSGTGGISRRSYPRAGTSRVSMPRAVPRQVIRGARRGPPAQRVGEGQHRLDVPPGPAAGQDDAQGALTADPRDGGAPPAAAGGGPLPGAVGRRHPAARRCLLSPHDGPSTAEAIAPPIFRLKPEATNTTNIAWLPPSGGSH